MKRAIMVVLAASDADAVTTLDIIEFQERENLPVY